LLADNIIKFKKYNLYDKFENQHLQPEGIYLSICKNLLIQNLPHKHYQKITWTGRQCFRKGNILYLYISR